MEDKIKVKLIAYTPNPDKTVAISARMCYSKVGVKELEEQMTDEKVRDLLEKIISSRHYSVTEHVSFTFAIEGISRACTHQLVRHRIASYSQQSQRYVDAENFSYIIPPQIAADAKAKKLFEETMEKCESAYKELREIAKKEDARYILPNATDSKIVVTMNTRSLYNFFEKRCCVRAQWEIRQLAEKMLEECKKVAPILFDKAGPSCVSKKYCGEGEHSCGKWKTIKGAVLLG